MDNAPDWLKRLKQAAKTPTLPNNTVIVRCSDLRAALVAIDHLPPADEHPEV